MWCVETRYGNNSCVGKVLQFNNNEKSSNFFLKNSSITISQHNLRLLIVIVLWTQQMKYRKLKISQQKYFLKCTVCTYMSKRSTRHPNVNVRRFFMLAWFSKWNFRNFYCLSNLKTTTKNCVVGRCRGGN